MKLLLLLQKHLVVGCAAAAAMHSLMGRQLDLGLDTAPTTLATRAQETAKVAVVFANALYTELTTNGD